MEKLDFAKTHKVYYKATKNPEVLVIRPAKFLSITGVGDPSDTAFSDKLSALYSTAYHLKFSCKAAGSDFVVAKLEGLWSFDETKYSGYSISETPERVPRSEWNYRMLIRMPDHITEIMVGQATSAIEQKKGIPFVNEVELFRMNEGKVVQILHTGPFDKEPETLAIVQKFIEAQGFKQNGLHHEIYLSDFRKTAPEKLKTILREPVR